MTFIESGVESPAIRSREASNLITSMFRRAWQAFCREKGLYEYFWSKLPGFHVTETQLPIGKKVRWGGQPSISSQQVDPSIARARGRADAVTVTAEARCDIKGLAPVTACRFSRELKHSRTGRSLKPGRMLGSF